LLEASGTVPELTLAFDLVGFETPWDCTSGPEKVLLFFPLLPHSQGILRQELQLQGI